MKEIWNRYGPGSTWDNDLADSTLTSGSSPGGSGGSIENDENSDGEGMSGADDGKGTLGADDGEGTSGADDGPDYVVDSILDMRLRVRR